MTTIPASQLVDGTSSVLSAGGSSLELNAVFLTQNETLPLGVVKSFDGYAAVGDYFGESSKEYDAAKVYFGGFSTATKTPDELMFARYPSTSAGAFLRGAAISGKTVPQIQALSGSISVDVDGVTFSASSLSLAAATSYSSAAALIESALNASLVDEASVTGTVDAVSGTFTGSISGYILTVTSVPTEDIVIGATLTGTGIATGTKVTGILDTESNGTGTYSVSISQTVTSQTITETYGLMTVADIASGTLSVGQVVTYNTTDTAVITALGTGTGLLGTYFIDNDTTASTGTITASAAEVSVTYDSTTGAITIASGSVGAASTIGYASGTLATALYLTQATGAVLSQGSEAEQPESFMDSLVEITTNWASLAHLFDPDGGSTIAQRLLFAKWINATGNRYAYVAADTDTNALTDTATTTLGYAVSTIYGYSGTAPVYDPQGDKAPFICGCIASIATDSTEGRITLAFKGQDGLSADVTTETAATNLIANGYNFYGAYATANQTFTMLQPGQISGDFAWIDTYVNQIWLMNNLQLTWVDLLTATNSIPFNDEGASLIRAAAVDGPIADALDFGAIRTGVTLSSTQRLAINNGAGVSTAANSVVNDGYYLLIPTSTAAMRSARDWSGIKLWYADGGSVHKIEFAAITVQ